MSVTVELRRDDATRDVRIIYDSLKSPTERQSLMRVLGVKAEKILRAYWVVRDREGNKRGWPSQHFWSRIAKRTAIDASKTTEDRAVVAVSDPALSAKVNGAVIRATGAVSPITGKPTRNLAIPMVPEVSGQWPRGNFVGKLFFIRAMNGVGGYLAAQEGDQLKFYYRLVPKVTIPKDSRAMPDTDDVAAGLVETAHSWFRRKLEKGDRK